jgi:hypothetical protein
MSCGGLEFVVPPGATPPQQGATLIAQDKSKGVTWLVAVPPATKRNPELLASAAASLAVALPFESGNHETAITQDGEFW